MTSPISSVGATSAAGATGATGAGGGTAAAAPLLDPQAFLQLLVAQLQYQDPSNPVDTSTFMNQTATLSQVQTMNSMLTTLTSVEHAQLGQEATAMIGKSVTYTDSTGVQRTGLVSGVTLLASAPTLTVGGTTIGLSDVTGVSAATPAG
jgi:flagellar basal-body rod modification protein FlgD